MTDADRIEKLHEERHSIYLGVAIVSAVLAVCLSMFLPLLTYQWGTAAGYRQAHVTECHGGSP